MKKVLLLFAVLWLIGCTQEPPATEPAEEHPTEPATEESVVTEVKVIRPVAQGEPGGILVVLLDPDHSTLAVVSNEYAKGQDIFAGDVLAVTHAGIFLESYPEQFGSIHKVEKVREEPDQAGLVTAVFDEFAKNGPALVEGITKLGVDLSRAGNLTEIEKRAVLWHIQSGRDVELLEGTYDELAEQGYIDTEILAWEGGVFFEFIVTDLKEDKTELTYSTRLWATGTGALQSEGVRAVWENHAWTRTGGIHSIANR